MIKRGEVAAGLTVLGGELEQTGEAKFLPALLVPLGEFAACLGAAGEVTEGLATVNEALARCEARDERWYIAELLRIKGELLLAESGTAPSRPPSSASARRLRRSGSKERFFGN